MNTSIGGNDNDGRKPCQCVTASTSNALQMGPRHKPGLREARPAANRLGPSTLEPEPTQHNKTFVWAYTARHVWLHGRAEFRPAGLLSSGC